MAGKVHLGLASVMLHHVALHLALGQLFLAGRNSTLVVLGGDFLLDPLVLECSNLVLGRCVQFRQYGDAVATRGEKALAFVELVRLVGELDKHSEIKIK